MAEHGSSPEGLRHRIPGYSDYFFVEASGGVYLWHDTGQGVDDVEFVSLFGTHRDMDRHMATLPTLTTLVSAAELKRAAVVIAAEQLADFENRQAHNPDALDRLLAAVREHRAAQAALQARRGHQS